MTRQEVIPTRYDPLSLAERCSFPKAYTCGLSAGDGLCCHICVSLPSGGVEGTASIFYMFSPQPYVRSLEHHTDWVNDIVLCMDGRNSEWRT